VISGKVALSPSQQQTELSRNLGDDD
jgi:hypothetical protein